MIRQVTAQFSFEELEHSDAIWYIFCFKDLAGNMLI